ncbi:ADP-ribosylglycohydrolase family protein [Nonomuraea aridisoli]|uniref:ADP-ribosylglycohydrolase family protein n=1 Tax=Nonomuraea aridisoli TaxID=2070368 RepID=UPI0034DCD302
MSEATRADRVRGLVLGLALGDSHGHGAVSPSGPIRAGVTTQLAVFTIEGVIRALVRQDHKGICHPPSVVWHAYRRWAALQGIELPRWDGAGHRPDGWPAGVPELGRRRGSAPATVTALRRQKQGTVAEPATHSRGCHALTRSLPLACGPRTRRSSSTRFARPAPRRAGNPGGRPRWRGWRPMPPRRPCCSAACTRPPPAPARPRRRRR